MLVFRNALLRFLFHLELLAQFFVQILQLTRQEARPLLNAAALAFFFFQLRGRACQGADALAKSRFGRGGITAGINGVRLV